MAKDLNVSLGLLTQEFKRGLKSATRDLNSFARKTQSIGRTLTASLSIPLAGAGIAALKSAADFERLQNQLTSVVGNADLARQQITRLKAIAESPGLGFEQAVSAAARLQAVGLNAGQAEEAIKEFGNAVARSGGGAQEFDGAILALTQIASKGKISAEEINQLNERIFEIRPALKKAFGTASSEELQKLGISSEEFISKVTAEFSKLDRVEGGLANAFENIGISIKTFFADIGAVIVDIFPVQKAIESIGTFLNNLALRFRALSPEVQKTILIIAGLAAAIGPAILAVSAIASGLATFLNPIGLTIAAIGLLIAGSVVLYNNNEAFRDSINKVGRVLKAVFVVLVKEASKAISFISQNLAIVKGGLIAAKDAFSGLGISGQYAFKLISNSIKGLISISIFFYDVVSGLAIGLRGVFKEIISIAQETVSSVSDAFQALKARDFKGALKAIGDVAATFSTDILQQGKRIGGAFLEGFKDGYDNNPIRAFYDNVKAELEKQGKEVEEKVNQQKISISPTPEVEAVTTGGQPSGERSNFFKIESLSKEIEFTQLLSVEQTNLADGIGKVAIANLSAGLSAVIAADKQKKLNESLARTESIVSLFAPAFDDMFSTIITGGKNAFQSLISSIRQLILELVKAIAKAAIFAALITLIAPGSTVGKLGFGGAFKKLLGGFSGLGDTFFADGGIVNRPTRGLVGESGPEAIIPLDRIFGGGGGGQELELRVEGTELVALLKNSESIYNRIF